MRTLRTVILASLCILPFAACGGGEEDGAGDGPECGGGCPYDYTGFDPGAPVSLQNDLMPIIARACNFSSCHGTGKKAKLFMGPTKKELAAEGLDPMLLQLIHAAMIAPAETTDTLPRITPGDPSRSFMMLKMDGCLDEAEPCTAQTGAKGKHACGDSMPQGAPKLACAERDLMRRWIAQGAQLN